MAKTPKGAAEKQKEKTVLLLFRGTFWRNMLRISLNPGHREGYSRQPRETLRKSEYEAWERQIFTNLSLPTPQTGQR